MQDMPSLDVSHVAASPFQVCATPDGFMICGPHSQTAQENVEVGTISSIYVIAHEGHACVVVAHKLDVPLLHDPLLPYDYEGMPAAYGASIQDLLKDKKAVPVALTGLNRRYVDKHGRGILRCFIAFCGKAQPSVQVNFIFEFRVLYGSAGWRYSALVSRFCANRQGAFGAASTVCQECTCPTVLAKPTAHRPLPISSNAFWTETLPLGIRSRKRSLPSI